MTSFHTKAAQLRHIEKLADILGNSAPLVTLLPCVYSDRQSQLVVASFSYYQSEKVISVSAKGRRRRGRQKMIWLNGITDFNVHEFE